VRGWRVGKEAPPRGEHSLPPNVPGLLDLRCRRPGEDEPAGGAEWGPQRRIRAQVLFQLLTGHGPQLTDQVVAVRLRGAQIVGG